MEKISKFEISPLTESRFVRPYRIAYTQDGRQKLWDAVRSHDSVAVLLFDDSRKSFILVKQFRPVVYQSRLLSMNVEGPLPSGELGITYELCAGIVDKNKSLESIAVEEVWEECGYEVSTSRLEKISTLRGSVGLLGSMMTIYYVRVSDQDRRGKGGGNPEEGEMIELYHLPLTEVEAFIKNDDIVKPAALLFALLWFMKYRND